MKTRRRFPLLIIAFLTFVSVQEGYCGKAVEIDLSKPDQSEVLEEVSKFTGLTKDVVELVNEEHAELFKGLDNTVFAAKVVSLVTEAKDTEALTAIGEKLLEIRTDQLVAQAFPVAVGTFLTVAKVCKTSLELVRDYYWVPKNEEAIYQAYKEFRTEDRKWTKRVVKEEKGRDIDEDKAEDTSVEGMNQAFDYAPFGKAYRPVREKMFDKMLEAKADTMTTSEGIKIKRKMDKDQMGPVVIADYEKKIDDFWISRMEMRYKKERMKERKAELIKEIWDKKAQQIEAIKVAAGQLAGPQRFFIKLPQELPQGWWKVEQKEDKDNGVPFEVLTPRPISEWRQHLYCSRDQGSKLRRDSNGTPIYDPLYDDKTKQWRHLSLCNVSVTIQGYITKEGKLFGMPPPETLDAMVKTSGFRYLTEMEQAVMRGNIADGYIRLQFFKNGYSVDVDLDWNKEGNSKGTEEMAIHFAKCIASHMESKVKKGK